MGLMIKRKKHYLSRGLSGSIILILLGFSPLWVGMIGAWVSEKITGEACHEGNCGWGALPWLTIYSLPLSLLLLVILWALIIFNYISYVKRNR